MNATPMTPEERASAIMLRGWGDAVPKPGLHGEISAAICSAVAEAEERCAKIAEGEVAGCEMGEFTEGHDLARHQIASAIRAGTPAPPPPACDLCEKGFPLSGTDHVPTQALGMIPITRCDRFPPACPSCESAYTLAEAVEEMIFEGGINNDYNLRDVRNALDTIHNLKRRARKEKP